MKRLKFCVFVLLILLAVSSTAQSKPQPETNSSQSKPESETKASMLELFYRLWKTSSFGWDKKQTERAAWILRDPDGRYRWLEWDYSPEHRAATWKGPVPKGVVAQIHTHPAFADPEPSKQDIYVAREINAPVYTISGSGIWKVGRDGKVTKEAGDKWYHDAEKE